MDAILVRSRLTLVALCGVVLFGLACAGIRSYPRYTLKGNRERGARIGQDRKRMERVIESYLGAPYRWGGEGQDGVDCSGLVVAVFRQALALPLPHSTQELFRMGLKLGPKEASFADLVFFGGKGGGATHVGICLGDGRFVHASKERGVMISSLDSPYFRERYIGARRIGP
ncbi:MAG: C40 family peptidase [bacterium]